MGKREDDSGVEQIVACDEAGSGCEEPWGCESAEGLGSIEDDSFVGETRCIARRMTSMMFSSVRRSSTKTLFVNVINIEVRAIGR